MNSHILIGDLADSREEAIRLSVKRYISNSNCSKCGFNIRLVSTWQCTRCLKRRGSMLRGAPITGTRKAAQFKRIMARNIGRTKYKSTPCGKCNNYDRLVSTNQCVNCLKERDREGEKIQPYSKFKDKTNSRRRTRAGRVRNRRYCRKLRERREHKITSFMRASIRRLLSLQPYRKFSVKKMSYNRDELISHLESLFTEGMTWDNYGDWHIDHIKPISAFISEGNLDPNQVNALSNLQPLWAYDNLSKGSKY